MKVNLNFIKDLDFEANTKSIFIKEKELLPDFLGDRVNSNFKSLLENLYVQDSSNQDNQEYNLQKNIQSDYKNQQIVDNGFQPEKETSNDKDTNIHENSDIATKNKEENHKTKNNNTEKEDFDSSVNIEKTITNNLAEKNTIEQNSTQITNKKETILYKNRDLDSHSKKTNKNTINSKIYELLSINTIEKTENHKSNNKDNTLNTITVKIQPDLLKGKNIFVKITSSQDLYESTGKNKYFANFKLFQNLVSEKNQEKLNQTILLDKKNNKKNQTIEELLLEAFNKKNVKESSKQNYHNNVLKENLQNNNIENNKLLEKDVKNTELKPSKIEVYIKPELKIKTQDTNASNLETKDNFNKFSLFSNHSLISNKINLKEMDSSDILSKSIKEALDEIISKARLQIGKDQFTAQIRLNPSIFGYMSVNINYENGSLVLKILVDNLDIYKKLQENLESIKFDFSKQGIQLDTLQVKFKESENSHLEYSNNFDSGDFQNSNHKNFYFEYSNNDKFIIENKSSFGNVQENTNKSNNTIQGNSVMNMHYSREFWG